MTPPTNVRTVRLVVAVLIAFAIHAAYDSRIAIGNVQPNMALTALLLSCLYTNAETGVWLGFGVGLLEASYTSRFVGSLIVTRTLAGFLVGLLEERIFRDNVLVAVASVFVGTLFVDTTFFLFAPQPHAVKWFISASGQAAYNAALALPLYFAFRRIQPRTAH